MRAIALNLLVVAALALGALLPRVASATPGKDACAGMLQRQAGTTDTITVNAPGTWCLDHDLVETADVVDSYFAMIMVDADDVTIDCRGYLLEYQGAADSSYGIGTFGTAERLTVRNCRLRGFTSAITAGGDDFVIEDNVILASRATFFGDGTAINGYGTGIIRNNRIHDSIGRAIFAQGPSQVSGNLIDGVLDALDARQAIGIEVHMAQASDVSGNTIRRLLPANEGEQHIAIMILSDIAGARSRVEDNVLVDDGLGGSIGVSCSANARVSDNVITGFFGGTQSCVDVADNDVSP